MSWNRFLSASIQEQDGADQVYGTMDICRYGLVTIGYGSKHPYKYPKLIPDHRQCHHMLQHRYQAATITMFLIWYLLMSQGTSPRNLMYVPKLFIMLLKGYWMFASKRQDDQIGRGWRWTNQPIAHDNCSEVLILVPVFQHASSVMMIGNQSGVCVWMFEVISGHY